MNRTFFHKALCFSSILGLFLFSYALLLVLIPALGGKSFSVALLLLIPLVNLLALVFGMPYLRRRGFSPARMVVLAVTAYTVILVGISCLSASNSSYGFLSVLIALVLLLLQIFPSYVTALLYWFWSRRKPQPQPEENYTLIDSSLESAD